MDEMYPVAGVTDDRSVTIRILRCIRQPMLYVHAGLGTFEQDGTAHSAKYPSAAIIETQYLYARELPIEAPD